MIYEIKTPWPPSVNGYWRSVRGRQILSKRAREFREECLDLATANFWPGFGIDPCSVEIELHPPDNRLRDCDNHAKAVLDAITHCGVVVDDSQVRRLLIRWADNHEVDGEMHQIKILAGVV